MEGREKNEPTKKEKEEEEEALFTKWKRKTFDVQFNWSVVNAGTLEIEQEMRLHTPVSFEPRMIDYSLMNSLSLAKRKSIYIDSYKMCYVLNSASQSVPKEEKNKI